MKKIFKLPLGAKVKDKITGFSGIIIGRTQWLYGCVRYTVQPTELNSDGEPRDTHPFDEDQLVVVGNKLIISDEEEFAI